MTKNLGDKPRFLILNLCNLPKNAKNIVLN